MKVGNIPPIPNYGSSPSGNPMPNELFNDVNALYFLVNGYMGFNLQSASGETLQLGAQTLASLINNLVAYYKANMPTKGTPDYQLYTYLTNPQPGENVSLATLASNIEAAASGSPPSIDTADLETLESEFSNPNSSFSAICNMLDAPPSSNASYWYNQTIDYNPNSPEFDPDLQNALNKYNEYANLQYQMMMGDAGDPTQQNNDAQGLADRILTIYDQLGDNTSGPNTNFGCLLINNLLNQLVPNPSGGSPVTILSLIQGAAKGDTADTQNFIALCGNGSGQDNFFSIFSSLCSSCTGSQGIWTPRILNPS